MADGVFPKTNSYTISASEINQMANQMNVTQVARLTNNTESTLNPTPANIFVNSFEADTATTKTNLTWRDLAGNGEYVCASAASYVLETQKLITDASVTNGISAFDYEIFEIIDECDNSSIDATTWPTSTSFAEDTNGISSSTDTANLLSKDLSSYKILNFKFSLSAGAGGLNKTSSALIKFTDGTNNASLIDASSNSADSGGDYYSTQYDAVGECTVFLNWSDKKAFVTISFKRQRSGVQGGANGGWAEDGSIFCKNYYIDLTGWTAFKVNSTVSVGTAGPSATARIYYLRSRKVSPTTTALSYFSSDNGSNYVQTYGLSYAKATTTSTTLKGKLAGTVASNEVIAIKRSVLGFLV